MPNYHSAEALSARPAYRVNDTGVADYGNALKIKSLYLLANGVRAQGGVFYFVDDDLNSRDYITLGIDSQTHSNYLNYYRDVDPLHARYYIESNKNVVTERDLSRCLKRKWRVYVNEFLKPCGLSNIMEIFIRDESRIIAGLSLIRAAPDNRASPADSFTSRQLSFVEQVRDYVEFNIRHLCELSPSKAASSLDALRGRLTKKESRVFDLLCRGACNKEISKRLFIEESTTKTHLRHIYAKFSVDNRRELLALVLEAGTRLSG